jgi:hypothetical protein
VKRKEKKFIVGFRFDGEAAEYVVLLTLNDQADPSLSLLYSHEFVLHSGKTVDPLSLI